MADTFPITREGKDILEAELKKLITEDRPSVVKAIEEARDHGDISENAEYDAAKDKQGQIEARIGEIQGMLANAHVVNTATIESDKIVFGATVELLDLDSDKEVTYQIVGVPEANVEQGKISVASPIARSLIGKVEGDEVEVNVPGGIKAFEVLKFYFK